MSAAFCSRVALRISLLMTAILVIAQGISNFGVPQHIHRIARSFPQLIVVAGSALMMEVGSSFPEAHRRRSEPELRRMYKRPCRADNNFDRKCRYLIAIRHNHDNSQAMDVQELACGFPASVSLPAAATPNRLRILESGANTAPLNPELTSDQGTTSCSPQVRISRHFCRLNEIPNGEATMNASGAAKTEGFHETVQIADMNMHASDTVSHATKTTKRNRTVTERLFFELPPELRNKIYRDVLVQPEKIKISSFTTKLPPEPGLLLVNRQIRQEALGIYYHGNHFRFDMYDINASAYMRWVRAEPIIRSRLQVWFKMYIPTIPDLAWQNLLDWLEELHYRRVAHGPSSRTFPGKRAFRVVVGEMKELAGRLQQQELTWDQILHVLESLKRMLVASLSSGQWL
ncbi:hypothetical protein CERZMDRAFT_100766 [Cercospora zeae-maydis SCOH1-5]|uniref:F-box domain-containing protein n=1 Tax=Cercospora zeae-maydis SCOH1-5 TaxID=717836 RepID=A0A6A6F6V6_9PEZI|nr:hypothetical protein CERZMDRAFT_100766 [Cercospora zeae-maydis SCOH1-5]